MLISHHSAKVEQPQIHHTLSKLLFQRVTIQ